MTIVKNVLNSVGLGSNTEQTPVQTQQQQQDEKEAASSSYKPSAVDAVVVRAMLERGAHLPREIVDSVVDEANYWAHSSTEVNFLEHNDGRPFQIQGSSNKENELLIRCPPIGLKSALGNADEYRQHQAQLLPLASEHSREHLESLVKGPAPDVLHPVRMIVFTIQSRDQGWSDRSAAREASYGESWTWFEAGLERFDSSEAQAVDPTNPFPLSSLRSVTPEVKPKGDDGTLKLAHELLGNPQHTVQRNKRSHKHTAEHVVVWSYKDDVKPDSPEAEALATQGRGPASGSGEFVRSLKLGDVVTLWGCARFPGWVNNVDKVKVDVYWSVSDWEKV